MLDNTATPRWQAVHLLRKLCVDVPDGGQSAVHGPGGISSLHEQVRVGALSVERARLVAEINTLDCARGGAHHMALAAWDAASDVLAGVMAAVDQRN